MKPTTLKNNIPAFIIPSGGTDAVTVLVLIKVGSRYEKESINGASHFIEHLMFKGTKKYPKAEDISRALDSVGAEYNAYTGKDVTGYWIKVDKRHVDLAVNLLHDMLGNSTFKAAEMNRERKVIMEEINMYHDNPMMHIDELLEGVMFDGSTLGWDIAGDHKRMKSMTRKAVLDFKDEYYVPERMVVAVSGAVDSKTKTKLNKTFGSISSSKKEALDFEAHEFFDRDDDSRVALQYKKTRQVQIALGFPSYHRGEKEVIAAKLLSVILGGSMSSRLFSSVREKKGLCYFIRASLSTYEDTGMFVVQSGLDQSRLPLAGKTIMKELRDIVKNKVSAKELNRAKDYLSGKTVLGLENSSAKAEWFAKQQLYLGESLTSDEKLAQYKKVTPAQIQAVAKKIFDTDRMCVAGIGPFKKPIEVLKHFK